jgi:CDP-diacylglycerol---serine O-phosphatidyltransferase
MVSHFRYRSFKSLNLRDRKPFGVLVGVLLVFLVVLTRPYVMGFVLCTLYVISGFLEKSLVSLYRRIQTPSEKESRYTEDEEETDDIEDKEIILKH